MTSRNLFCHITSQLLQKQESLLVLAQCYRSAALPVTPARGRQKIYIPHIPPDSGSLSQCTSAIIGTQANVKRDSLHNWKESSPYSSQQAPDHKNIKNITLVQKLFHMSLPHLCFCIFIIGYQLLTTGKFIGFYVSQSQGTFRSIRGHPISACTPAPRRAASSLCVTQQRKIQTL